MPATVPKYAQFQHEHSKIWSAEIAKYDAYVLIISEYNCGLAGGTKNALDYLWNEWTGKPVIILSYGSAGGSLASAQLKGLLDMAKAQVVEPRVQLPFAEAGGEYGPIMAEGKISDKSRAKWEGMFGEITKAANELKALLSK
ncbi:flavoprotein-like protein [Xylaria sp. CBS 124048]|nr:flavoprotein-like protein [Xylaria sp. CBS 124048]